MSRSRKSYTVKGYTGNLYELSKHFNINSRTVSSRLRRGWSVEEAILKPTQTSNSGMYPQIFYVGKYRGNYLDIEKRFGVTVRGAIEPDTIAECIRNYHHPEFYSIGDDYKGSLKAISVDFGCTVTMLKDGIRAGKTPYEVLSEAGLLDNKRVSS